MVEVLDEIMMTQGMIDKTLHGDARKFSSHQMIRASKSHVFSDAPRSMVQVDPQPPTARLPVTSRHQPPSIVTNPIFPQERSQSYQLAPGAQPKPRVSVSNASGALGLNSTLDSTLQGFANIPSGRYADAATYLGANPSILTQGPQALLTEAIRTYRHASRGPEMQYTGKMTYGDNCLQKYVILRQLHRLQQRLEARRPGKGTTEEMAEVTKRYFDQLLDNASPSRKQLDDELIEVRAHAMRQSQSAGPGPQTTATTPQQLQTQTRTSSMSSQAQQGSLLAQSSQEISDPNLASLNLYGPGPKSEISRSENIAGLDSRYVARNSSYYQPGRVFAILWHEPYNDSQGHSGNSSRHTYLSDNISIGRFGERIYSSIRRMVVVRQDHGCCVCIQINTYGKRGLGKFTASPKDVEAHTIIHMDDTNPQSQPGEPRSSKRPIAVKKASPDQRLNPWSRLCFSQPHTVQHTVKALDVGWVTKESLPYLLSYFQLVNALPKET
ncbi:hypothetical protein, variant 1 [Cladophialophora immunda]|uniref:DUF6590 domain-containing protein n=1 Tax=Cladophialophora immunda TaxID=569365 RepID=A0A0D2D503_9EURO|nr:hypothetical protein, variant 1 [Cladophialophora immunda]KIW30754.1 hypothetical protein, variant 1 [Cladophialophora immunda]